MLLSALRGLSAAVAILIALTLSAAACDTGHWIDKVSDDGQIVLLEDGSVWAVDPGDEIDTALWLPTTSIIVCHGKLINTDDQEVAGAQRLR